MAATINSEATRIVALLKACAKEKNLHEGIRLHAVLLKKGLLEVNCYVASTLVNMYAKCGDLAKASEVLEKLPVRDTISWNALIAGFVQQGQATKALKCFQQMQRDGFSPNAVTFTCILKACGSIGAIDKGEQIHEEIARQGLPGKHLALDTTLMSMYAKCGALAKAKQLFDELPVQTNISWSALIAGYTQQGMGREALKCFERMQDECFSPDIVILICVLKACGSIKAFDKGKQIHDEILRYGLLGKDAMLGTSLVDMYAKCGALTKAAQVLDELPVQTSVAWSALIAGYVQQGQGKEALMCFERMQEEGHSPDRVTFISILKACGTVRAADKGERVHVQIFRQRLLKADVVLGTALMDMYAKCGEFLRAEKVMEDLPVRNVVSWNALIAGYIQQEKCKEALSCSERMQLEGLYSNAVTFICILKACGSTGAADKGEQIHNEIVRQQLLGNDIVLGNALVDMYVKCGALAKAARALDGLPVRDVVSWNALIAGYAQAGQGEEALKWYERMQKEGFIPDTVTFSCILKACGSIEAAEEGEKIHHQIIEKGLLDKDLVLGTTLVDMYAKCGAVAKAAGVLDQLPVRNIVTWNTLITGYVQNEQFNEALKCYYRMRGEGHSPNTATYACILKAYASIGAAYKGQQIHEEIISQGLLEDDNVLATSLVDMYAKCGEIEKASRILNELSVRSIVSWNALIAGYVQQGQGEEALKCFERMKCNNVSADAVTFICILKACGSIRAADKGEEIFEEIAKQGLLGVDSVLDTTLVDMYAKCCRLDKAADVLFNLPVQSAASWNALIAGYVQHEHGEAALKCFERMKEEGVSPDNITFICTLKACGSMGKADKGEQIHQEILRHGSLGKDSVLGSALVDMYAKCGALDIAAKVLDEVPVDTVSWNALITGYTNQGKGNEALKYFERMEREGISVDTVTFICALKACGTIGAAHKGEQIHREIVRRGWLGNDIVLDTALVDMYAKCGALTKAAQVLYELPARTAATWNTLIAGYAQKGQGEEALASFERMQQEGVSPNGATLACVLNACTRSGLWAEGQMHYMDISVKYGMIPDIEHQSCIVDLLGRAGEFDKVLTLIKDMPCFHYLPVWRGLLGTCRESANVQLGKWAFENALQIDKRDSALHSLMTSVYAAAGVY